MNMTEDSETIRCWGDEAFGPVADLGALADRAAEELAELKSAIAAGRAAEEIGLEAADVAILLHRLAGILDLDLNRLVQQKMAVNRTRSWTRSGDGTGRHV